MKIPCDQIPFIPMPVVEAVVAKPLQGHRMLDKKRRRMTDEEVREFANLCEARLRKSYERGGIMVEIARPILA